MESNETARAFEARAQDSTASRTAASSLKTINPSDLTRFQIDILVAITGATESVEYDEVHGLAVKRWLEEYYDEEINHGRLYPNLDELVDNGLVAKGSIDRRTNSYELTPSGRYLLRLRTQTIESALDDGAAEVSES